MGDNDDADTALPATLLAADAPLRLVIDDARAIVTVNRPDAHSALAVLHRSVECQWPIAASPAFDAVVLPRFHVQFTPNLASWLNQVERWFATVTQRYIRRGTHRSTRQVEDTIKNYVKVNNLDPKPFVWSQTAEDIVASVKRFCLRASTSQH